MKILVDARSIGTKPTGVGMYGYNFIQSLKDYSDVEMHVLTDVSESVQMQQMQQDHSIKVHCMSKGVSRSFGVFEYFRFVKSKIIEIRPDVFWELNNMLPVPVRNPYGLYAVTIHDAFPITMPNCFIPLYKYYFWFGVQITLRCCDLVIYNSNETKKQIESIFSKAKSKESFISRIIIPPVKRTNVERNDNYLYLGTLEKRKGTDILIKAYERYVEAGGKNSLILAGDVREDDMRQLLQEATKKYNGENGNPKLEYFGYATDEDKSKLYCGCKCLLFPSRAEGFGMPIVEALGCGMDVIASDLPIFQEVAGETIGTFKLSGDLEQDAEALAEIMMQYDNNLIEQQNCVEKQLIEQMYQAENLGDLLHNKLKALGEKNIVLKKYV